MQLCFFDTETCGYHGPTVLIQYAINDGPIILHEVWCEPIRDTLDLIEAFCDVDAVVGFNLAFDWFHICKTYNTLALLGEKVGYDEEPRDHIDTYAELEEAARDGDCVKPKSAMDLMLFARKGPYQSTMDRKDIAIRRVPKVLAVPVMRELERRIELDDLYFARKKDKQRWKIYPSRDWKTGKDDPEFRDIVLKFAASSALKVLAKHCLHLKDSHEVLLFGEVHCERTPIEVAWAPCATSISSKANDWFVERGRKKGYAWPAVITYHIEHWRFDQRARRYAEDDVTYTRGLYEAFGSPEHGDDDSILACLVGANRWRGFSVDLEELKRLRKQELIKTKVAPRAPAQVYAYLTQVLSPTEKAVFDEKGSTKKVVLEDLTTWETVCADCKGEGCTKCHKKGTVKHPVAIRAEEVLDSRKAYNKVTLFDKLIEAGRLHPAASVIGSLSSRMAGRTEVGDGKRSANLNALGIQRDKVIRRAFPLATGDLVLNGGDFAAFEVSIADARYDDPELRKQLLTCFHCKYTRTLEEIDEVYCPSCGYAADSCKTCKRTLLINESGGYVCECDNPVPKGEPEETLRKIHGLFAMELKPGMSYDDIVATKGTSEDLYDMGKRGIFSQFYGGNEDTLVNRLNIDKETAVATNARFATKYQGVGRARREIFEKFCSMRQPKEFGKVYWNEPSDYVESLTGFPRYFTLENKICHALFKLAENPPKAWNTLEQRCVRRERSQKIGGAVRSAVFAAAFQIQASNMRAAANHEIQSTGAVLTKRLQVKLWRHQPPGVSPWRIQLLNIHDELMTPAAADLEEQLKQDIVDFVQEERTLIPLLKIDWGSNLESWADK